MANVGVAGIPGCQEAARVNECMFYAKAAPYTVAAILMGLTHRASMLLQEQPTARGRSNLPRRGSCLQGSNSGKSSCPCVKPRRPNKPQFACTAADLLRPGLPGLQWPLSGKIWRQMMCRAKPWRSCRHEISTRICHDQTCRQQRVAIEMALDLCESLSNRCQEQVPGAFMQHAQR